MFRNILFLLFFQIPLLAISQQKTYSPLSVDPVVVQKMLSQLKQQYDKDSLAATGEWSKKKRSLLSERYHALQAMLNDGQAFTDTAVTSYFDKILEVIKKGNPQYNYADIRLIVTASDVPNASSWGEGTIVYNAGLFYKLENEAQAAFILCHELAHYLLNHSGKKMDNYLQTLYSDEVQTRLKDLKKQEFGVGEGLENLQKTIAFDGRRHSRMHEMQADSLGIILLSNSGYNLKEAARSLQLLDSIDNYKYNSPLELKERLSSDGYIFRDAWLRKTSGLGGMAAIRERSDSIMLDSLKTHPDMPVRVAAAQSIIATIKNQNNATYLVSESNFKKLQTLFDYEIIEYCYRSNHISKALLYAFQILSVDSTNGYLFGVIGNSLARWYFYQQKHRLDDITEPPAALNEENYDTLLRLINRARLDDVAGMSNGWAKKYEEQFKLDETFLYFLIQNALITQSLQKKEWIAQYKQQFPKGRYLALIQ